jgi:hypothetical protein
MSCNPLNNVKQDLVDKGLVSKEKSYLVDEKNYTEVEQLIKDYNELAKEKYGFTDELMTLNHVKTPDAKNGHITNFHIKYNAENFQKFEKVLNDYNEARTKAEKDLRNEGRKIQNLDDELNDLAPTFTEDDFEDMPSNSTNTPVSKTVIQPNYNDVLEHKRKLLINVDKTITRLYNDKRLHDSVEITKKLAKFNLIKDSLEKDIKDFNSNIDKVSLIRDFFEKDIQTINELLANPTLDNVFLAKTMFDYLEKTKKSEAKDTDVFALNSKQEFEKEVQDIIDYIETHLEKTKNNIDETVDNIFLQLLEKNEDTKLNLISLLKVLIYYQKIILLTN